MPTLPDLDLPGVRIAFRERDAARFKAIGARLGVELGVAAVADYLARFEERDRGPLVEALVKQLYVAITGPFGYGFEHIVQPGTRVYSCLVARDHLRLVAAIQQSVPRTPFPNPGWRMPRWFKELSRNRRAVAVWAREPDRLADSIVFPLSPSDVDAGPTNRHGADLLACVLASPRDDGARLVYADWLLEHGDVRGELIQLQCELATAKLRDPRRTSIRARERELVSSLGALLAGELGSQVESYVIRRGLVDSITIRATALARHGEVLMTAHPIRHARILVDNAVAFARLATLGVVGRIPELELVGHVKDGGKRLELQPTVLGSSRMFAGTEKLSFIEMIGNDTDWRSFLEVFEAPRLRELELLQAHIGPNGLDVLSRALPSVESIALRDPDVPRSHEGAEMLLRVASRPRLRSFSVAGLLLPNVVIDRLASEILAHDVSSLSITRSQVTDVTLERLAAILIDRPLDRLELDTTHATIAGLAAFLRAPGLANVGDLVIDPYLKTERDLDTIAEALLATSGTTRVHWFWGTRLGRTRGAKVLAHLDVIRTRRDGSLDLIELPDS